VPSNTLADPVAGRRAQHLPDDPGLTLG